MKVLIKSAWGSDDPTKAAFAFQHANALAAQGKLDAGEDRFLPAAWERLFHLFHHIQL